MERYFSLTEVSDILKVSIRTLIRWIKSGKLKAFKLAGGRFWRIRERDLKKILR
jgi:excisionase family DNA binding protein